MKLTVNRKKEIKLEKLLYQEYLRRAYIVYNCQHYHVSIKRENKMIIRKRDQDMSLNCFQRLFEKLKLFKDVKVFLN